ncbi:glycosyl hydrolase family 65 protein [Lipingzhangella sp. LS1_29]|uniref:Glycosyl hydrolase family 65 protein n=1 Tax=Lipingzhangella rawalii TaxID=2055835 RepID=A0ABU2HBK1_9ACTN|nr:glycosyl hydrolase family 65 protein [Lipingzhangella rawalii]MDS1272372.1 glycosyl hydrolase family 65 protein [Lipingzhangella rawalii]
MSRWLFSYPDVGPDSCGSGLREALCTLGNGRFATRGAAPEAVADETNYPGTYLAGCYNRLTSTVAGREITNEDMVNLPNWLPMTFRIDNGPWFGPAASWQTAEQTWELDVRRGVLTRLALIRDDSGRETRLTQRRLVSMAEPTLAALETTLVPLNWSGRLTVRSALDARTRNTGVARYRDLASEHLHPLGAGAESSGIAWLHTRTVTSEIRIAMASRTVSDAGAEQSCETTPDGRWAAHHESRLVAEGTQFTVTKVASVHSSGDRAAADCLDAALREVQRAHTFEALVERHTVAWRHLWRRCGVEVADQETQRAVNLHVFHLLQTLSPHTADLDVGVPARGLHGEAYRGHVFWDELFVFPFLCARLPNVARSLLLYRWRRLPEARAAAAATGLPGAMFPWQSGSDGREETQTVHLNPMSGRWLPDRSHRQRHVGIAVAYNVWEYYRLTGDRRFLADYGAELVLEVARYFAGLATYNKALNRYEIRGVMGPDEYHDGYPDRTEPGLDNNAYTNIMTAWLLRRALHILDLIPGRRRSELVDALSLTDATLSRFEEVSRKLRVPFHGGVISQFEGYAHLEELDWDHYRATYPDVQRLDRILESEHGAGAANRYKVSKQADTLMLFFLLTEEELAELLDHLGYGIDTGLIPRTVEYYLARTSHGSTLSAVVHAWVLARTDRANSWTFFSQALRSDIDDTQGGTTAEGIHLGAMAGTLDLLTRCYTGLAPDPEALRLDPRLPRGLHHLAFEIDYHGHADVRVDITEGRLRVELPTSDAPPLQVATTRASVSLAPGSSCELPC